MFPEKARAFALLEAAGSVAAGREQSWSTKRQVKADKLITFFTDASDPPVLKLMSAVVVTRPVQRYLNAAFKVDMIFNEYWRSVALGTDGLFAASESFEKLLTLSLEFLTGDRGEKVLIELTHTFYNLNSYA